MNLYRGQQRLVSRGIHASEHVLLCEIQFHGRVCQVGTFQFQFGDILQLRQLAFVLFHQFYQQHRFLSNHREIHP